MRPIRSARPRRQATKFAAHLCLWAAAALPLPGWAWSAADLDTLTQQLELQLSGSYKVLETGWSFLSPADCFQANRQCFFSNPDGVYGMPAFSRSSYDMARAMAPNEAWVILLEMPPQARYTGITSYLHTRCYDPAKGDPTTGCVTVLESLSDSLHQTALRGTGSSGTTGLSAVVMTGDATTASAVTTALNNLGYPTGQALATLPLPVNTVPLRMGKGSQDDRFTVMMRLTYPEQASELDDYIARSPVRLLRLTPQADRPAQTITPPVDKVPGTGVKEDRSLKSARDELASLLVSRYQGQYTVKERPSPVPVTTRHFRCTTYALPCNADNPDAIYTLDLQSYVPASRGEKLLFVGVNHTVTGKTSYLMHALYDASHNAGVLGTSDAWLAGTAQLMAGPDAGKMRYAALLDQLYAFTLGYDCSGEAACRRVPEPTPDAPIGISFGQPMDLSARYYLEPATDTRPDTQEVILHRVFLLTPLSP